MGQRDVRVAEIRFRPLAANLVDQGRKSRVLGGEPALERLGVQG